MDAQPDPAAQTLEEPTTTPSTQHRAHMDGQPDSLAQPLEEPTTTLPPSSKMPQPDEVKCRSCAKVVASVSPDGLHPAVATDGCVLCQQFQPLYDAMQAAIEHHATFHDRRDTYAPKIQAFLELRKATLQFNNFLLDIEAAFDEPLELEAKDRLEDDRGDTRATKRGPSSSPSRTVQVPDSPPRSPDFTRKRKRLKFSDTVEYRDDYRSSECFARSDDAYKRGRYAAPEGEEHLDTSGLALTHLKFSGMKKVGNKWVDVWEEVNDPDRTKKGKKNKKPADEVTAETEGNGLLGEVTEEQLSDPRSQRLARRKNGVASQKNFAVRSKTGNAPSQLENSGRWPLGTPTGVLDKEAAGARGRDGSDGKTTTSTLPDHEAGVGDVSLQDDSGAHSALPPDVEPRPEASSVEGTAIDDGLRTSTCESTAGQDTGLEHTSAVRHQAGAPTPEERKTHIDDRKEDVESQPGEAKSDAVEPILRDRAESIHATSTSNRPTLDDIAQHVSWETAP